MILYGMIKENLQKEIDISLQQLNSEGGFNADGISFTVGEYAKVLNQTLTEIAPNGSVAFIGVSSSFKKFGKELVKTTKSVGVKLFTVLFESTVFSVANVSVLFNYPEDVRCVVLFDKELIAFAEYFANTRNIPIIYIPVNAVMLGCFNSYLYIKNQDRIDKVYIDVKRKIIIDEKIIRFDLANLYASSISALVGLIDYRVYGAVSGKTLQKIPYSIIKQAVTRTFGVFSLLEETRREVLFSDNIKIALADYFGKNRIITCSSATTASMLCDNIGQAFITIGILDMYRFWASDKFNEILDFPDFNKRVEYVSEFLKIRQLELLKSYKERLELFNDKDKQEKIKQQLKEEILSLAELKHKILNTYFALGGKNFFNDKDKILSAIKHSADFFDTYSAMNYVVNAGFTEKIAEYVK